jgi:diketogulonate reductase-like aldo/keto reductase
MTHIDTAEMYGPAEDIVGAAIRRFRRSDLFIVSKVLPENASYSETLRAAERSLRRIGTDYLDLYLVHWPGRHPVAETMAAMEDLVAQGKIRFIGVSNFDVGETETALAALTRERLACNQVLYNLRKRGIELDLMPFCEERGIAVVGYAPFGGFPTYGSKRWRVLSEIAGNHDATPRQVVLRFLTRRPGLFAIPKAANLDHVRENAGGGDLALTADELDLLDHTFPAPSVPVPLAFE